MGALEQKGSMPPQHLTVIDTTLSMPGATLEAEYQRRINAINAMTALADFTFMVLSFLVNKYEKMRFNLLNN